MYQTILFAAGASPAVRYAASALADRGITITDHPDADVTHLLLPVPSFESDGRIRGGGIPAHLLAELPENVTVIGGNLEHPILKDYRKLDLLKDPAYLAENAAITADCAIRIAASNLDTVFSGCPFLIIGWGRIGKCLANLLKALGADVTVAARKDSDRAILRALGYRTEDPSKFGQWLHRYRVIYNTAPTMILSEDLLTYCRQDCIKIDLASSPGIAGDGVIWARGLPGKDTPEASGLLIAKTVIRLLAGKEGQL